MPDSENPRLQNRFLKGVAFLVNTGALVMLILKVGFGTFTNDDLLAVLLLAVLVNLAIAFDRRRTRTQ